MTLILELFPGLSLFGRAFEEQGACVVRGPDRLWGGEIATFTAPAGVFDGLIGGPPCQRWSALSRLVKAVHGPEALADDLIPEFCRVVREAQPRWFVMENVPEAPEPTIAGYHIGSQILDNRNLGERQRRVRRFTFGFKLEHVIAHDVRASQWVLTALRALRESEAIYSGELTGADYEPAVCASAGGRRASVRRGGSGKRKPSSLQPNRSIEDECALQGLPADFLADMPFTSKGKRLAIGNGVPLPMGRAVASAVQAAHNALTVASLAHGAA